MQNRTRAAVLFAAIAVATPIIFAATTTAPAAKRTTPDGLTIIETGAGADTAVAGDTVWVKYTGKLQDGTKFDSSADHDETKNDGISFPLGKHQVIRGWDEGIEGMHVGDKRTLIIPPELGYGAQGAGASIPPNATLTFDVELVGLKHTGE